MLTLRYMNYVRLLSVSLFAWCAGVAAVHAGTVAWSQEYEFGVNGTGTDGGFDITYKGKTYDLSVTPFATLDDNIRYYASNITQGLTQMKSTVEQQFNLAPNTLNLVSYCDSPAASNCHMGASIVSSTTVISGKSTAVNTFNSANTFEYLAVHFGGGELLFAWADPGVKSVTITGIPNASLSDYRAYVDPSHPVVIATPLPGAALLFASAALVGGGISRRRSSKSASA
jgi:hypothetical protein